MDEETFHKTYSKNPLKSFSPQPLNTYFETQEKGEEIILLLRAHPVTLVPLFLTIFFLLAAPPVLFQLTGFLDIDLTLVLEQRRLVILTLVWYFFTFGFALYRFLHWYFNVHLLTNERVVDIDFLGLINKAISFAKLGQIEDVTPRVIGATRTFFNFGDVNVQTAGTVPEFEFHAVPRPDIVAREILEQVRLEEAEAAGEVK